MYFSQSQKGAQCVFYQYNLTNIDVTIVVIHSSISIWNSFLNIPDVFVSILKLNHAKTHLLIIVVHSIVENLISSLKVQIDMFLLIVGMCKI